MAEVAEGLELYPSSQIAPHNIIKEINMTCLEFVCKMYDKYMKDYSNALIERLQRHELGEYVLENKDKLFHGMFVTFIQGRHIGIAKVSKYLNELHTFEYNEENTLQRILSLYDDSIHIIDVFSYSSKIEKILEKEFNL